jgi:hypothetical protein
MSASLKIIEIGDKPFVKSGFPTQTLFFSTTGAVSDADPATGRPMTLWALARALRDPALSLVVCHPTFFAPWDPRWLIRAIFSRRLLRGEFPFIGALAPQLLRWRIKAPIAVVDLEDLPLIKRNNVFLLDRCTRFFKRELPADRWRLFLKTAHASLPTPRFRKIRRYADGLEKVRPLSLGIPMYAADPFATPRMEKTADIFFAGRVEASSWVRQTGMKELLALRARGIVVDIPDAPLSQDEFFRRCGSAWLTWSPEGYGWECFRHYEALACGSVPVCNLSPLERHSPLRANQHAVFYPVEPGGLTDAVVAALADKPKLQRMADDGRAFVAAHHTPAALARYIVQETIAAPRGTTY